MSNLHDNLLEGLRALAESNPETYNRVLKALNEQAPVTVDSVETDSLRLSSLINVKDGTKEQEVLDPDKFSRNPEDYIPPNVRDRYECLQFDNPVEFGLFFHPLLEAHEISLYEWQVLWNLFVTNPSFTKDNPCEAALVAANGSGKDAFCIALLVVFLVCCRKRSRTVITTKDFGQMMNQTYPYIKVLCFYVNEKLKRTGFADKNFLTVVQGHITRERSGSDIVMFVTDEPGRAEGYHPFPDFIGSELTIIINEAKNVLKEIFQALRRCTGYCRMLFVSSAGDESGYFYDFVQRAVMYPAPYKNGEPYARRITAFECPHIPVKEIEKARKELEPWLFGSIYMSEFGSIEGEYFIPRFLMTLLREANVQKAEGEVEGGLDLSLGVDKTELYLRKGNYIFDHKEWRITDANTLEISIATALKTYILADSTKINVDAGGNGKPIYQHLKRICRLKLLPTYNNSKPFNRQLFISQGAEDYFHVRTLIMRKMIPYPNDEELVKQLCSRKFVRVNGKYKLEDKADHKSLNGCSPDKADAFVLAYRRYRFAELNKIKTPDKEVEKLIAKVMIVNGGPPIDPKDFEKARTAPRSFHAKLRKLYNYGNRSGILGQLNGR